MNRLQETSIRTPEPVLYCDDASIIGDSFFAMTALDGESVRLGERLPERFRHPPARERVGKELIDTLAELHALPLDDFDDICNTRSLQEEIALASDRLDAAAESMGGELPRHRAVGDWLRENAPTESPISVCHGDYRPSNVLFSGEDMPALSGILDWETAFLGDPFTELGYLFLRWRDPDDASPSLQTLEERFPDHDAIPELRRVNECGLSPFTGMPGSPPRRKLVSRYENRTGLSFDREGFYVALSAFALGSVWADIHRESLESGEPSDREPWIDYMALVAERAIDDSTAG